MSWWLEGPAAGWAAACPVARYSLLVPVVGMVGTAALLGERPGPVRLLAGLVILGGVLIGTHPPGPPDLRGHVLGTPVGYVARAGGG